MYQRNGRAASVIGVFCSMKIQSAFISLMASASIVGHALAEPKQGWELAFYLGTSFSKDETLTIKQDGYEDITLEDGLDLVLLCNDA